MCQDGLVKIFSDLIENSSDTMDVLFKNVKYLCFKMYFDLFRMDKIKNYKIISKFTEFINYCRALEYDETPDYEHLRNMLRNRMKLKNYEFDKNFDWIENDPFQQVQS